jgi:hypothetical protein
LSLALANSAACELSDGDQEAALRFFFNFLTGSGETADLDGQEFSSSSEACAEAHRMVADAMDAPEAAGTDWTGWRVQVRDAAGEMILSVPFILRETHRS